MPLIKTDKSFYQQTGHDLKKSSYLQLFNILKNTDNNRNMLNIWKTYITIHGSELLSYTDLYIVKDNDWWENISYEKYGTPDYWWILPLINKIENPFETLIPGQRLYVLKNEYINTILNNLKAIREL